MGFGVRGHGIQGPFPSFHEVGLPRSFTSVWALPTPLDQDRAWHMMAGWKYLGYNLLEHLVRTSQTPQPPRHTHTHMHTHARATRTHTCAHTHARMHTHMRSCTHTHTHTHTHGLTGIPTAQLRGLHHLEGDTRPLPHSWNSRVITGSITEPTTHLSHRCTSPQCHTHSTPNGAQVDTPTHFLHNTQTPCHSKTHPRSPTRSQPELQCVTKHLPKKHPVLRDT